MLISPRITAKWTCISIAPFQSTDHSKALYIACHIHTQSYTEFEIATFRLVDSPLYFLSYMSHNTGRKHLKVLTLLSKANKLPPPQSATYSSPKRPW